METRKRMIKMPRVVILWRVLALLLIVAALARLLYVLDFSGRDEGYLYVYVFDVGQSDAILLRTGDKTMLIDTGTAAEEAALRTALMTYGVDHLDLLVLTHPHEDHIGNTHLILNELTVERVLLPVGESEDVGYRMIREQAAARARTETAATGQRFSFGSATVEVLAAGFPGESANVDRNENNAGTVLRVCFGDTVMLFMGDAEQETEAWLLATYGEAYLNCDFLKVGHHGSSTSTTAAFAAALTPTVAAISCDKGNTYGFPHAVVLANLAAVGSHVYRTDESGTLVFGTDGKELRVIPPNTKGL